MLGSDPMPILDAMPVTAEQGNRWMEAFFLALFANADPSSPEFNAKLVKLGETLAEMPQVEMPVAHNFAPQCYVRQIAMPEGALVIGKTHATTHHNILMAGEVIVWTAQDGLHHLKAPHVWTSVAGTKKYLFCRKDTLWATVHVTESTDLAALESALIIDDVLDGVLV